MATYFLSQNPTIASFTRNTAGNVNPDTFIVDTGVASSRLRILQQGSNTVITDGTHTATLSNFAVAEVNGVQFTNQDGSLILVGNNLADVAGDAGNNGSTGGGQLAGGTGGDLLVGLGGGDVSINGGAGSDYITGNQGDDAITDAGNAAAGNDTVFGGQGNDTISYAAATTSGNELLFGNLGDDAITGGVGNDIIFGGQGNDTIATGTGNNSVQGGLGLDSITGGTGNDTIQGNDGDDVIAGGSGNDLISGNVGADRITLTSGATTDRSTVFGGQGSDTITVTSGGAGTDGNFMLFGNLGNDTITGATGSDTINGGQGNDSLVAGAGGADSLTGGLGLDTFDLTGGLGGTATTADTITDFVTGQDSIIGGGANAPAAANNYREFANSTVTDVASALTAYNNAANNGVNYTFIAGATDGFLIIDNDTTATNTLATDGTAGVVRLTGLNSLASFTNTDIVG